MKNNILLEFTKIIKEEFADSDRTNKYLLLAIIANLPTPLVFFPYLTQAITIVLIIFFLKKIIDNHTTTPIKNVLLATVLVMQIIWIPYISQLLSILILGILFLVNRMAPKK